MKYNTTKKNLILPEYGRNVQMMAEHLLTIRDKDRRTAAANELVSIMINMNPMVRDTKDYKQKIWDFLAQLCEYKLDIDYPYPITKVQELPAPAKLQYNMNDIRLRHYGYTVERLIDAAVTYKNGEEKTALVTMIANNMKRNYVTWNQKSVTDEIVLNDLYRLSKGLLKYTPDDLHLMSVSVPNQSPKKQGFKHSNNNQGKRNKNNNRKK